MKENPKVVISGGGTGGHIFPAIAIADALKRRLPEADILFIGAKGRMEMERVPKAGYPIEGLWISGMTKDLRSLSLPIKLIDSINRAIGILKRFKPDVVIGVGGFASGPTLMAANYLHIPTVIQEQNSYPGKTNRNVGRKAKAICVAYDHMEQWFPKEKIHLTGNPLRANIAATGTRAEAAEYFNLDPEKPVALLVGGSQGALGINKGISAQLKAFKDSEMQLIWQTGKTYFEQANEEVKALGIENKVKPTVFIDRMDLAYTVADVVVSRAGAMSISELALVQKPVIFVPLPTAAEDHQTKNAQQLVEAEAAMMVRNAETETELIPALLALVADREKQEKMKANIGKFARPNAADDIVNVIVDSCLVGAAPRVCPPANQ
ncbi:MAG: undecaprenyldiphospho-muramoylpentapeptide beta-N-acetylglucosaminyltransferase [Bacteroidales bacterium]|nr:undecaprenyldiphospho-muramoylpentapeptide beta-N-acetylglucosaminyltransferase [Bacteroidales bacterium]